MTRQDLIEGIISKWRANQAKAHGERMGRISKSPRAMRKYKNWERKAARNAYIGAGYSGGMAGIGSGMVAGANAAAKGRFGKDINRGMLIGGGIGAVAGVGAGVGLAGAERHFWKKAGPKKWRKGYATNMDWQASRSADPRRFANRAMTKVFGDK